MYVMSPAVLGVPYSSNSRIKSPNCPCRSPNSLMGAAKTQALLLIDAQRFRLGWMYESIQKSPYIHVGSAGPCCMFVVNLAPACLAEL